MLRKGAGDTRIWYAALHVLSTHNCVTYSHACTPISKVYDSPCMPEADATFAITALGIQDVDD